MKKFLFSLFSIMALYACQQSIVSTEATPELSARVSGRLVKFNIINARLSQVGGSGEQRLDITGLSYDGSLRLIITVAESSSYENAITAKDFRVAVFNEDDPATDHDESNESPEAFFTASEMQGNSATTDLLRENGVVTITGNVTEGKRGTVSGKFYGSLISITGGTDYILADGTFTNIAYAITD